MAKGAVNLEKESVYRVEKEARAERKVKRSND